MSTSAAAAAAHPTILFVQIKFHMCHLIRSLRTERALKIYRFNGGVFCVAVISAVDIEDSGNEVFMILNNFIVCTQNIHRELKHKKNPEKQVE